MLNPNIPNILSLIHRSDSGSLIAGSSRFPTFPIFSFHHPVYLPKNHHEYSEKIDLRFCMHHTYISLFCFLNVILHTHMISSTVPGAFELGICLPIYLKCNWRDNLTFYFLDFSEEAIKPQIWCVFFLPSLLNGEPSSNGLHWVVVFTY